MSSTYTPIVYIISAPSGSGKSTLVNELLKLVPNLDFSISYTTRNLRGSEQNGKQYHFVSREEFEQMIRDGEFLEHAEFDGNYYGTARRFLQETGRKGHDLLLDIDVQGAAQIKKKLPEAVSIFVLPPDRKTLEWRLRKRSEDAEEVIARRLVAASREIENYDKYDYILINDKLEESIDRLEPLFCRSACDGRRRLLPRKIRKSSNWPTAKGWPMSATGCAPSLIPLVPFLLRHDSRFRGIILRTPERRQKLQVESRDKPESWSCSVERVARRSALIDFKPVFRGRVPMKLIEGFDSNYRYILVAARRARQLQSGAPPVVDTNSRKPCRIAQDEIRAGKVKWEIPETRSAAEQAEEALDKALGQD